MSEQAHLAPAQPLDRVSTGSNYSPETDLPNAILASRWARAMWAKKHPKGPYCVVFHLHPLHLYVAGWIPFAGSRCIPRLVDCFSEDEAWAVDSAVSDLGHRVYEMGPSSHMLEHSAAIAAKYAENGRKGGRPPTPPKNVPSPSKTAGFSRAVRHKKRKAVIR